MGAMRYAALAVAFVVGTAILAFLVALVGNAVVQISRTLRSGRR